MTEKNDAAIGVRLPILFSFRDMLFGNGFVVEVSAQNGRAVCAQEDDAIWMYGVNPGGMAASGATAIDARREFRKAFSGILQELAREATSFKEFVVLVNEFFNDTNPGSESDWLEAVQRVRTEHLTAEGLPKVPAESPRKIDIEMREAKQVTASDNSAAFEPQLAA